MNAILAATGLKFKDIIDYPPVSILRGRATFVSGESGSGKSTLFRLLNATASPSAGAILYEGNDIADMDTVQLRREIILASQSVFLFDGTIRENFEQFYDFRDETPINDEKIRAYLALCCANFPLESRCETMSGGERQRIFLAIHLSLAPKVLMMDEPTSALDEITSNQLISQIKAYCANCGTTLIMICHDRTLVDAYADEVIRLVKKVNA